ncbi:CPBP family intramembrane glutamic endopeptidase [Haladaptatus sp. DYF46]|uniref:CPBP family intramembrane glutamic endopeptidase n=1 Tax=Haladaptatus sp. DYF46 TaxID=2886041 RepID=UPI001E2D42D8|nr:CPBP family intramembrane glutamic endopeptidase [Haladaptatus sp. DYF46]
MPSPNWNAFAAVTLVVLLVLIALARASQGMFVGENETDDVKPSTDGYDSARSVDTTETCPNGRGFGHEEDLESTADEKGTGNETSRTREFGSAVPADSDARDDETATASVEPATANVEFAHETTTESAAEEFTPGMLLVNVAFSQGLFGVVLLVAAVLAAIPAVSLGLGSVTVTQLGIGIVLGVALYVGSELGQRAADALDIDYEDGLRELLTPDSIGGWVVLLVLVLPIIAGFEELLFRSSLVGAFAVGFGISPWFLVVASSVAFATGHGAQGPAGILVTGTLGAVLASAFVLTGSLLVVVVAHYLVNALEFVVHAHGDRFT